MRRFLGLIGFLVLALAACAETAEPARIPAEQPTILASPPAARALLPTATPTSLPTSASDAPFDTAATPTLFPTSTPTPLPSRTPTPPSSPTPSAHTVSSVESPWPRFLRELSFGLPAGNSYNPRALAIHGGRDWLYARTQRHSLDAGESDAVTVIDLESGQALAVAEIAGRTYGEGALVLDPGRERVYATNPAGPTTLILDAVTLDPVGELKGLGFLVLDAAGGRLYAAGPGGLEVLDAAEYGRLLKTPLPPGQNPLALALDPTAGRLYVAHQGEDVRGLSLYDAGTLEILASIPLPGRPDDLLPDPEHGRLYLTLDDGEQNLFWIVDQEGGLVEERRLGEWTQTTHLALDPGGERLFLGRDLYNDYGVAILDLQTGQQIADVPLDQSPGALVWDEGSQRLLVSHTYVNRIGIVDPQERQVSGLWPTAVDLVDLDLDPERGHVYVTDSMGRLHVLGTDSDEELAGLPAEGRIAVDSPHGRFYTGGQGADRVRIFDSNSLQQTGEIHTRAIPVADAYNGGLYLVERGVYPASLETLTTTGVISDTLPQSPGFSPNPTAVDAVVDPSSGRVFAIINNGVPGSNGGTYLYVYEPETYEKVLADTERSPSYLDVDPNTGQAYVSRTHLAGRSTGLLANGHEYTARLDSVFGALRVDPVLDRVYLTTVGNGGRYLLILDAGNLEALEVIPIPGTLLALDPQRHLLYLATGQGRVQIWSATGGSQPMAEPPEPVDLVVEDIYRLFPSPDDGLIFALDRDQRLYRSNDGGSSWWRIYGGLPNEAVLDLVFSPDSDAIFAALAAGDQGFGVWTSTDAGQSWQLTSQGLNDLAVTDLLASPVYAQDQTLFAAARRGGLLRSTDAGQTWEPLSERYHPEGVSVSAPGSLAFSPTYAQDQTLFVNHYGLQRSTDGGDTWTGVWPQTLWPLGFSPDFATDRTLFGWTYDGGLLRSTDGGDTWSAANVGLSLIGYGSPRVLVSPDYPTSQTLYFIWGPSSEGGTVELYRSTDAAASWEKLDGELPSAAFLIDLTADGAALVTGDAAGESFRWPVADMTWQAGFLPPMDKVPVERLVLSPGFVQDQTLFALSKGAGILRSEDAGLSWVETGFPIRTGLGESKEMVAISPDTLFIGSVLGLYRFDDDGSWTLVGGGLHQGVSVSSPAVGVDGSLRVLVSPKDRGDGQRVFVSTDDGRTWTQPLPELPYAVDRDDVYFSPSFATDGVAFVALSWGTPWRSVGGGDWQEFGPPSKGALTGFYISPVFDDDGLLLAGFDDGSLWRSTDGGDSWISLAVPWSEESVRAVTFSSAYAQDGVLLASAGDGLYRSTDRGSSWTRVLSLDWSLAQFLFSPGYALDGEIYLIHHGALYHSADRGQTWQALHQTPWQENQMVWLQLSPAFTQDQALLAWLSSGLVYQSSDGGRSWRDVSGGLPSVQIQEVLFSLGYADDGLIYLVPQEGGLYKRVGDRPWISVTEHVPPPTLVPLPTPTPLSLPTSTPAPCAEEPVRFHSVWRRPDVRVRLGCPRGAEDQVFLGEQPFERGRMIWESITGQIYVLLGSGTWQAYDDTWTDGQEEVDPALVPPEGRIQPQRGFGKVWREQLGGPDAAIGWATSAERPIDGWRQRFDGGLLIWTDSVLAGAEQEGTAYLLYDDGRWQAASAPLP